MMIGNIHKGICQAYLQDAYKILAYFPVLEGTKLKQQKIPFKLVKRHLYHMCLSECLKQLREYGTRYVDMNLHHLPMNIGPGYSK